jgi:peptidoglycan L-alanyl-D-glutamate endopeptidase CwlK
MPSFSNASLREIATLDSRLQELLKEAIKHFDFKVLEGFRSKERQNQLFEEKKTKVLFPNSRHNIYPSRAVDIAPWPIDWNDSERFVYLAGFLMGLAATRSLDLRWGGDWDGDTEVKDETFRDLGHFELRR